MNKFEEALLNVEYSTDYWEYRCNNAKVVSDYIVSEYCTLHQTWEADLSFISEGKAKKIRSNIVRIYGTTYVWTDFYEDGLIEAAQLEKIVENQVTILYGSTENSVPFAQWVFKLINEGIAKMTYNKSE